MKKDENAFIKILIVLVIASLALLAIVYFMMKADKKMSQGPIAGPGVKKDMGGKSYFDNKGRMVVGEDISISIGELHSDSFEINEDFVALCEGSEWQVGEEKDVWYFNEKHQFKLKVPYTEFYNDDLIVYPFHSTGNVGSEDRFSYYKTVLQNSDGTYSYPCGDHGSIPGVTIIIEEIKTIDKMREEINNIDDYRNFEEFMIGDWEAFSYEIDGMVQTYNIVLLGKENNYHFEISSDFEEEKEKLLNIIENDFVLVK